MRVCPPGRVLVQNRFPNKFYEKNSTWHVIGGALPWFVDFQGHQLFFPSLITVPSLARPLEYGHTFFSFPGAGSSLPKNNNNPLRSKLAEKRETAALLRLFPFSPSSMGQFTALSCPRPPTSSRNLTETRSPNHRRNSRN